MPTQAHTTTPNRAAHLARWLTRQSSRGVTRYRVTTFAVVGAIWLLLSIWGTWDKVHAALLPRQATDLLYSPFMFLVPQPDFGPDAVLPWQWQWARLAGALLPVLGIYWTVLYRGGLALARLLIDRRARGHVVLFGEHGSADAVALATAAEGEVVLLVDRSIEKDAERLRTLSLHGVITKLDSTLDPLAALCEPVKHAGRVLLWSGLDNHNIATGRALLAQPIRPREIMVRVEHDASQRALRQAPRLLKEASGRLRPVSQRLSVLRQALCGSELIAASEGAVHVRLWGDDPVLMTIAGLVLRHCWSIDRGPPMVSVTASPDGQAAWAQWMARHPLLVTGSGVFEADQQPKLMFLASDVVSDRPVTRHIVAQANDDATITSALDIASWCARCDGPCAPVQPVIVTGSEGDWLTDITDLAMLDPICLGTPRSARTIAARAEDEAAAKIHQAYAAQFGDPDNVASVPWQNLAETFVHANRATADHRAIKQWDAAQALAGGMDKLALIDALAVVEHRRWSAERLLDGWTPGDRDNARQRHPNLVPWAVLTEADRVKDRAQVAGVVGGIS